MLPPGWAQVTDGQGLVYYVNHVTQEVSRPAGGSSGAALAALLGLCPAARGMRCHATDCCDPHCEQHSHPGPPLSPLPAPQSSLTRPTASPQGQAAM